MSSVAFELLQPPALRNSNNRYLCSPHRPAPQRRYSRYSRHFLL